MPEDVKKAEEQDAKEGGDKYRKALVDGFIKKYYNLKEIDEKVKFQFYQNLMGEREARSVAERAELTEEERKGVYPNYDEGAFRRGTGDDVFQIKQERTGNDKKTVQVIQDITKEVGERNDQENKPLLPTKNRQDSNVLGSLVGRGITDEKVPYKGAFLNTADSENLDVKFSLRNKNITEETEIPYVVNNQYITVQKNNKIALAELQDRVKNLPRGTYENKATGYKANINSNTINKALKPTHKKFNEYGTNYVNNLNAILNLPELFENAVYVDTIENQKSKNANKEIKGFHHFVAPLRMKGEDYRALITAREKENSNTLYVLRVEVMPTEKKMPQVATSSIGSQFTEASSTITIPDLIKDVKIYNYDTQENQEYTPEDIRFSLRNKNITEDAEIPYVVNNSYITVPKNNKIALVELQDRVKNLPRGTYENKATGYKADINSKTIGKILKPKPSFNPWGKNYTDNLNAATQLPELFKNAVYIDTKENQKSKNANKEIKGFHHFVAPITMNGNNYRVMITAREKENSNILYIVDTEIMQNKEEAALPNNMNGNLLTTSSTITIPDLIKDVKIYNYDTQENQEYTSEDIRFSLRNKNITEDTEIPYVVNNQYITVQKNNNIALAELQDRVKNLPRGTYENKATGYKADINRTTIGKILNPTNNNGHVKWSKKYINNLNAATQLPELFKNAVYVDTKENQKSKNTGKEILGYHHFIAPIYMNGEEYRVRIVAREKEKSDTLYIVETEILPLKDGVRMAAGQMPPTLGATPSTITIPDLIKDVKIYNYDTQENQEYTPEDIRFSLRNKNITEDTEIPYVVNNSYITVQKNNKIALAELQDRVKNLPRGTYENKATGYKADINRRTIGKILNPTKRFNPWSKSHNYIENLNAAAYLPELFENAVYLDTHENQKKNNGEEFHYFVAPIYMNNKAQRALITARSGEKYDVLYVVRVEVIENKEDAQAAEQMLSASIGSPSTITIPDLIKDVKIYNYDTQENQKYSPEDIKYHLSKRGEDIAPVKGWAIYGKDVLVKNRKTGDDIAPVRGDILPEAGSKTENAATVMEDIAPVRKDIKPKTTEMSGDIAPVKATEKITEYVNTQPRGEEKQRPLLRSAIGSTSREIKRLYGSKYDPTKDIARLYKGIHEGKYNEEEIARISTDIGQRIVENIKSKKVRTDEANEVLGLLRQTKVKLDSEQKTEVEAKYGSYNEYRKNMMGKIILSKDGTSLEAVWEDWSELYPDIFDIDMDPKAMPEELENIMSSLQRSYQIEDTPDAEEVGAEIYDRFFSIPQRKKTRAEVQDELFEGIRKEFENNGYDIDEVFSNAKSKTTFSSVDNTPQRFIEKTFGYKAGQIINDLTINKEAENESKCVRWLNTITGKKTGLLPRLSEKYNIKPGSKEDAAVQMYAEGFYVNKKQEYVRYGDEELAKDFPDEQTQENIKKLARDPEVRAFYDNTLRMINETRKRNAYPEIPKRENYFLHFHAMEDTFSKIGIPFNINDIKLKDLPSDLNGITAGLRPGQPYFASANRRTGIRTTYGALRGMERYAFAAGRQIYHIDDIQTLRAIWKHIADTYGQAKGLENLDELDRKQQEEQIKRVYDGHLSTFARFINEQANILAGKTAALDRGFESIFGRKGLAVLNFFDKQAGRNAVGYNISSALTNLVAGVQGISKMPKADAIKAFAQTASNKLNNLRGEDDGFAEQNDFIVRRKGSSSFYRTPWQKATDRGYVMMQAVDDITTEFVVRGKYNEYIRRGMSEADAHEQAGKWAAKLLGDRSLGQMPQLYNSKVMNIFAKFQLEVRNQLDSMLYDTVKEAEIDTESISSAKKRNSIKAAKITSTLAQLAVFQHLFGKAFEAVTGYNPAFDIISVLMTMLGIGDDEDSEDTFKDNLEQAFFELLEDLPYTSTLTGGRIPISSMLPVEELVTGKDSYGNEKSRLKTLLEASPYLLPAGYGQIKKTYQGLKMFDEDLPVKGSYTNSGNLRYPVEDTVMNRIQAGLFGQYANKNAREYFDEERIPLKTKDIEEYKELNIPIGDYWKYKDEIKKRDTKPEKVDYISSLDLPVSKKNLLANNVLDRKEKVDLDGYEDYGSFEEFDFATKNPGEYSISKTVGGYSSYKKYREEISSFKADRDSNGKSISGTKKAKIVNYINSLNTSYGSKLILYKMQYPSDDTYNYEIVEYLNSQQYLSYNDIKEALEAMEFTVDSEGNVRW